MSKLFRKDIVIRFMGFTFMWYAGHNSYDFAVHYRDQFLFTVLKNYEWKWGVFIHAPNKRWVEL